VAVALIIKPLASKHHAEIARLTDRACAKWATVEALDASLGACFADKPSDALAEIAFGFASHVLALGGWGWWSCSPDGKLQPALVSWDKAWVLSPIDRVLFIYESQRARGLSELFAHVRALAPGVRGALAPVDPWS
jgi:hypothetical protein